jgi:pimeloyl-ACP methyl ester carboxylesterase
MSEEISVFRSPEGKAQYYATYDAVLKQWPVPYEELYIPTRFGETHVIASGSKEADPMVLLHPSGGSATIWWRNVGPLSRHYRTYAIDTISEPNKSSLRRPIHFRHQRHEFADWTIDLFHGLQVENTYVVGNSFGGFLALNAALHLPERVKKVVLISPADTFTVMWAWYWHFPMANILGSKHAMLKAYDWIWQDFPKDECMTQLRAVTALVGRPRHWFPSVFSDSELRTIRMPVLLLVGDREVIYKPEDAIRRAIRLVPGLKAEIIPNANHIAEYTAPEVVNKKILDFFADGIEGVKE